MYYVMSDIHGEYDKFLEMLDKIKLQDEDTLYILGNVVDYGDEPMELLNEMADRPNVYPVIGNHDRIAIDVLTLLMDDILQGKLPEIKITEVDLPLDEEKKDYDDILEAFFKEHPLVHHCITFNSKAHLVGSFLQKTNRRNIQIMGYDMVPKNVECIHNGSISFLIAQHAYQQGYASIDALFNAIVMKRQVNPVNYMPIEILTKENVDFYRRTAI